MEELEKVLAQALEAWPGAQVRFRTDWGCYYFTVADKSFAMLGDNHLYGPLLTFKAPPAVNAELRELYESVIPGYHTNKTHWNSIILTQAQFSEAELIRLLLQAYETVLNKLPRKTRESLAN